MHQTRRVHTWKEACAAFLVSLLCACHHRLCTTACAMCPGACRRHEPRCTAQSHADDDKGRLCLHKWCNFDHEHRAWGSMRVRSGTAAGLVCKASILVIEQDPWRLAQLGVPALTRDDIMTGNTRSSVASEAAPLALEVRPYLALRGRHKAVQQERSSCCPQLTTPRGVLWHRLQRYQVRPARTYAICHACLQPLSINMHTPGERVCTSDRCSGNHNRRHQRMYSMVAGRA